MNPAEKSGVNQQRPRHQAGNNPPSGGNPNQSQGARYQGPRAGQPAVTVQTAGSVPLAQPLPDYLIISFISIVLGSVPLGIAALCFSLKTRDGNCSGNRCLAESSSRKARLLGLASLVIGILLVIGYIVLIVLQLTNKLISDA
ncbi:hypothetical protein AOLI_G00255770 [Acnodon oligacanthus]